MLMAPPIPGLRGPAPVRTGRTFADILLGILAVLALIALTVGIPAGLMMYFGSPVPHGLSLKTFTSQLDLASILKILSVVAWLAWVQLVWCVLVEIRAAVRNVGVPGRVPMSGPTQSLANKLVTAALLLFSAAAALSPALPSVGAAGAPMPAHSISVQAQLPGHATLASAQDLSLGAGNHSASPHGAGDLAASSHRAAGHEKVYVVKPPAGRYHESLWEIAHNHLGDGRRYHEIFELNKDHVQPDGTKLTKSSLIRPGWVLRMPGDAHGPGIQTVAQHLAQDQQAPRPGGDDRPVREAHHQAGHGGASQEGVRQDGGAGGGTRFTSHVTPQGHSQHVWPAELAAASLLAAGVLSALGRQRRMRLWQRAFGRRLASPDADAALAEQALRFGANDEATQLLDTSLRYLSRSLAASRKAPPTVFAAYLSDGELDLWIAPPDENPPAPWTASDSGQVWKLSAAAASALDPAGALAPYPGLVTLGTSDTGRIMVDLEASHGLIAMHGPAGGVQAALAAIAVELVTNCWSDRMKVTLVGFGEGLEAISPERAKVTPSLDAALADLEDRAEALSDSLSAAGLDSVLTGRSLGGDPEAWAPHYLIIGVPPTPEQAERLVALARVRQRTGIGIVVAGEVPGATWTWELTSDGRLKAGILGFDVAAQLLPPAQYAAVVSLFTAVVAGGDPPLTDPAKGAPPAAHLVPTARFPVEVSLLGPVSVTAPGPVDSDRLAQCTEIVAYLAAHPGGVHPNVLSGAIWPRGVPAEVRDAALARVVTWLGSGSAGQPNVVADSSGRLSLTADVRVDWQVFRGLVARAASSGDEEGCLARALELVHGPVADGHAGPAGPGLAGQYGWLATDDICYEVTALVADTAHRLSVLLLESGDPAGAMNTARSGLRLAFDDEELWRDLLRAAHATGREAVLRAAVDEVSARTALDEVMPRMAPGTEALINELLPSWRSSAA
jgi:hypothetical protein